MKYNKLVRDKIPAVIKKDRLIAVTHVAGIKEYREKLFEKLTEEVNEFLKTPNEEEMADLLEVLAAINTLLKIDRRKVARIQSKKAAERGRFKKRIILTETRRP